MEIAPTDLWAFPILVNELFYGGAPQLISFSVAVLIKSLDLITPCGSWLVNGK